MIVYRFKENGSDIDQALRNLLLRARERTEKFVLKASEIQFFGHIVSMNTIKPDPKKVEAIVQMQPSEDAENSYIHVV